MKIEKTLMIILNKQKIKKGESERRKTYKGRAEKKGEGIVNKRGVSF